MLIRIAFLAFILCTNSAFAVEPSHRDAIIQLLDITQTKQLLDQNSETVYVQISQGFETVLNDKLGSDEAIPPELQKEIDIYIRNAGDMINELISYNAMEEAMVEMYAKAFSETEIYQLIEFYKTPVGQLTIERMPIIMQEVQLFTQEQMMIMLPKLEELGNEFKSRLDALEK